MFVIAVQITNNKGNKRIWRSYLVKEKKRSFLKPL